MRKLFLVLLIFTSFYSIAQYSTTFNDTLRLFGMGGDGFDNVLLDSNIYYVLGYIYDGNNSTPHITKINESGVVLNKRKYIDTNYNFAIYPYNSMVLKDSILLFCGQKWDISGTLGFITAVNKHTLDTLWSKTYSHPDTTIANQPGSGQFSDLTAIKSTPDGGYILTGNYNKDCITGNLRSFLMKIDSVGNVEWRRTYSDVTGLFDIELADDGGYYFLNPYGNNINKLAKTDSIGIIQWQKLINSGMTGWSTTSGLKRTNNNSIIGIRTFMYNNDISYPLMGANVFKIDLISKQILWDKTYLLFNTVECISLHQSVGVQTLPDGSIIVSGTAKNYGHDAVILKLNSNGDSLWCKSYDFTPDPWDCQVNDLIITDDGGFMGVGFFSDQGGSGWTAWMFKTDENGVIGFEKTVAELVEAKVFPNPARDNTTIELSEYLTNTAALKVYNSLGQLVLQRPLNKGEKAIKLDLKGFEAGVYFFEVVEEDGVLGSGKFVRE